MIGGEILILMFQNTVILRAIPGLNELGKALLGNKQIPRVLSSGVVVY